MKIAHLILAHNNPEQLNRLVKKLQHPDADIYIHLDLKTDIAAFGSVFANNNTFVVNGRVKVYWGSYSIVQATLNGFKEILRAKKGYDYINILSTNDYPIKSADTIHQYFCRHPDKIFIVQNSEYFKCFFPRPQATRRLSVCRFFTMDDHYRRSRPIRTSIFN